MILNSLLALNEVELDSSSKRHIWSEMFDRARTAQKHMKSTLEYCTVRAFRALLAMIVFAQEIGHPILDSLLADAALLSHVLKLHSAASIKAHTLGLGEHEHIQLQRAFWLFYSIEKPHCLYSGRPSMLNDDFIDYNLPESTCPTSYGRREACYISKDEPDWFSNFEWLRVQCQFAKICDRISKGLFSQAALHAPISTTMQTVKRLLILLNYWGETILCSNESGSDASTSASSPTFHKHGMREDGIHGAQVTLVRRIPVISQTCMAKFIIHGRCLQIRDQLVSQTDMDIYEKSQRDCLVTAKNFIQVISNMSFEDILAEVKDRKVVSLVRLATMIIAVSATKAIPTSEELRHIGMACGVFGRIACLDITLLDEVSELGAFMKKLMSIKMEEIQKPPTDGRSF
ncbi:hypothetical protein B0O99DRAFT_314658 [Bisporella sp. PMI_857]|nr:hypothetical protein B0O99DRAFT_314658 [Bisporella sp. PMI_857]